MYETEAYNLLKSPEPGKCVECLKLDNGYLCKLLSSYLCTLFNECFLNEYLNELVIEDWMIVAW